MSPRLDHVLAPLVVAVDYAALSWFPALAASTGHPEAAFRVGTVAFVVLNAGVLLLGHRALRGATARWARLGAAAHWPAARWVAFGLVAVVAVGYRLSAIARTPLDPGQADMLPLIAAVSRSLLAGGNPYHRAAPFQAGIDPLGASVATVVATTSPHDPWMAYVPPWLPALWLPYVPAAWAGLDLRLVGLLAVLLTAALLGLAPWSAPSPAGGEPRLTAWLRVASAGGLLLAPAAVWFGAIGHTQTYWLYLTVLLWALARGWWALAGVGVGLCAMSRHTVLPLLPILALYAWRCLTPPARSAIALGAAAVVVVAALPFGAEGAWQFTIGTPIWYMRFGDQGWNGPRWWVTHTFGLGAFLYPVGLGRALPWVGAGLLIGVYALALRRVHDLASCARLLALALLVIQVSVPTPFRYEFFPIVLVLSALPLVARAGPERAGAPT
jgi:hypothetical protein